MVKLETMPFYFRYLSYLNFIKYGLDSTLINIYGFGRCDKPLDNNGIKPMDIMNMIPEDKLMTIMSSDKIDASALLEGINAVMNGISDNNYSIVLDHFKLENYNYFISIFMLLFNFIIFRVLTYYLILRKVRT